MRRRAGNTGAQYVRLNENFLRQEEIVVERHQEAHEMEEIEMYNREELVSRAVQKIHQCCPLCARIKSAVTRALGELSSYHYNNMFQYARARMFVGQPFRSARICCLEWAQVLTMPTFQAQSVTTTAEQQPEEQPSSQEQQEQPSTQEQQEQPSSQEQQQQPSQEED